MGSEMAESGAKTAKKRGREKGCAKTGGAGCYAPPPGLKGAELRAWLLQKSSALESLVKLSCGKPIKLHGPTGKVIWHYPDASQVLWAVERILKKALPDLAGLQLSGEADGAPIALANRPADPELARRVALLFHKADPGGLNGVSAASTARPVDTTESPENKNAPAPEKNSSPEKMSG